MPTYEYSCEACGHEFELFQPMGSEPPKSCPECRKRRIRRRIGSGAGIIFRGSGFYQTDYRSSEYRERAKAEAGGGEKPAVSEKPSASEKPDAASDGATPSEKPPEKPSAAKRTKPGPRRGGSGPGSRR
jgi:putative FmdB family regulatory protein